MQITNPKLATLEPTWRRYRGLSVLFDNPGTPIRRGVLPLVETASEEPSQALYRMLADLVADVDPDAMRARYGFCPLPRPTYHVTVCDGPSEQDLPALPQPYRTAVASVVDALPGVDRLPAELDVLRNAHVMIAAAANPVTFRAADVVVRGHVLAAALAPAGDAARGALARVARSRAALAGRLRTRMGIAVPRWRPHVSLGYFPNREAADAAAAELPRWRRALATAPAATITFRSAALYGFRDMVSYFRLG